jgi:hypothetical protein
LIFFLFFTTTLLHIHINTLQNYTPNKTNAQLNQSRYDIQLREEMGEERMEANGGGIDAFRRRATDPGP